MTPAISCTRHKGTEPRAASRCLHAHAPVAGLGTGPLYLNIINYSKVSHGVVQTRRKSLNAVTPQGYLSRLQVQCSAEHSLSQVAPEAIRVRKADKQLVEYDTFGTYAGLQNIQ
ncbi:hypothetical protein GE21DRAFT_4217 [Neurospora crassa]|uniref:Uncharacterized protein n=1 Tax=Neurospora crassa (strain ATCC 24698 / 74-OR23-1A / CBS 708.71 / DSM 1257 / FGSC 987) TaxID=367110 RepID=Q7SBS2_NEUCR|nr:hypothetical protein NCU06234 [Neurospora crassa OR74A]EAA33849.1 hypothetical protein NCU06234 [Neurospora crassa OR74A]KHE87070.1 hypothetical protein GE21DRAFT_4217 [Neurospora crassa]|eukprot:XP_963085.1 hypothetical protein NCU06234 [Neurospora crassa OR74A]